METIDDDVLEHGLDYIDRQHAAGTPFFVWFDTTHMHLRTHPKPESLGQAGHHLSGTVPTGTAMPPTVRAGAALAEPRPRGGPQRRTSSW